MALLLNVDIMDGEKFTLGWSTFQNHLLDTNKYFLQKTTVLAEKVFHPAAGGAQLKAFITC